MMKILLLLVFLGLSVAQSCSSSPKEERGDPPSDVPRDKQGQRVFNVSNASDLERIIGKGHGGGIGRMVDAVREFSESVKRSRDELSDYLKILESADVDDGAFALEGQAQSLKRDVALLASHVKQNLDIWSNGVCIDVIAEKSTQMRQLVGKTKAIQAVRRFRDSQKRAVDGELLRFEKYINVSFR